MKLSPDGCPVGVNLMVNLEIFLNLALKTYLNLALLNLI